MRAASARARLSSFNPYARASSSLSTVAAVFDIDGVLLRGNSLLPGARDALLRLQEEKVPFILLTNGGGETEVSKARKLSALLDVAIEEPQVVLSHTPMRSLCTPLADKRVLVLGCRDTAGVARHYGLKRAVSAMDLLHDDPTCYPFISVPERVQLPDRAEPIAAVLVLHDPNSWGLETQVAMDVLRGGWPLGSAGNEQRVPLYISNSDITFAGAHAVPRLAGGAFTLQLEALWEEVCGTPLTVTRFGKPHGVTFAYARSQVEVWAKSRGMFPAAGFHTLFMTGDNPRADIRGANAAGPPWRSVLVRSGIFQGGNDAMDPAHVVVDGVGDAVTHILRER